jgi:protein tyrosine phosphatase
MTLLDDQFKRLEEYCTIHITQDKNEFKTNAGSSGVNHNKNRFSNVLPCEWL